MGRKTWESIPPSFRPLSGRVNIVLSRSPDSMSVPDGVVLSKSLADAMQVVDSRDDISQCFVIGGGELYREAMNSDRLCKIFRTLVHGEFECDTFIPCEIPKGFIRDTESVPGNVKEDKGIQYEFQIFVRPATAGSNSHSEMNSHVSNGVAHEEYQYLNLIRDILQTGIRKGDRTGTGTIGKFGASMRFNLRESFPLLTTKRVFWRGVVEELLWFISGATNANLLREKDIHIWDGNGSKEYLAKIGLGHREEGDLGPVYGFQWRHFGAKYTDMHADYTGQGVDQLANVINTIKTNPNDRRILLSAWNPADLGIMALPPCHMFCQFYVDTEKGELSCQMYQRSCDMGLGVPFNIASYSLLTCLVAHVCNLKPGEFIHTLGDVHVYSNHVEALKIQLEREPRPFPKIRINPEKRDIDSFVLSDITLEGYDPHAKIAMDMAV
uniref:DHFR domain-containing protein n=1 Tax=Guillardia theta TaxID=55529 RepID=A0A7S4K7R0_GUITH